MHLFIKHIKQTMRALNFFPAHLEKINVRTSLELILSLAG